MTQNMHHKKPDNKKGVGELIDRIIGSVVGGFISLLISGLFVTVIIIVVWVAVRAQPGPTIQLLNTAMALVASTLSGIMGYYFGRRNSR